MPANLTPEYLRAELDYKAAKTPEEKLACLERMLAVIPKHKGTDHLQADLKQRIARLRDAMEKQSARKKGPSLRVKPEGAGQIMLVGPPNSGKSSLLAALTDARPEIADYPCTTREPIPGMVEFEGVQIQLVDLPPVWREHCESFVWDNLRGCQGFLLVVDLAAPDPSRDVEETLAILKEKKLEPVPDDGRPASDEPLPGLTRLPYVVILNKSDLDPEGDLAVLVRETLPSTFPLFAVSAKTQAGVDQLPKVLFDMLRIIRVYSKAPGRAPDLRTPFTLPLGATVTDFAAAVHQELAARLKMARVWGSARFPGQAVPRDYVLHDRDVVELSVE